jgi:hypothetical protein
LKILQLFVAGDTYDIIVDFFVPNENAVTAKRISAGRVCLTRKFIANFNLVSL